LGVVGEGEGVDNLVLALIKEWEMAEGWLIGGAHARGDDGGGEVREQVGDCEERVGAMWRRRGARCAFYWVGEGEHECRRGGGQGRN
jgi:hypothetical protein